MKRLLFALLTFLTVTLIASGSEAISVPGGRVGGFSPAHEGFWYTAMGRDVGFIGLDGSASTVALPFPFGFDRRAPMVTLGDGSVVVGGFNSTIAHIRPDLTFTITTRPNAASVSGETSDLTLGADGNIWYAGSNAFGTIRDGHPIELPLYDARGIVAADDGRLYVATSDAIYRVSYEGQIETRHPVEPCTSWPWIVATPDGTIWVSRGFLRSNASFEPRRYGGVDATVGPDGRVWVAGEDNRLRVIGSDGEVRAFR